MKLLLLKLALTLLVSIALALPFFYPSVASGFLTEMKMLGVAGSLFVIALFLLLVFFYCKDLQKILELIKPENRRTKPKSVWLMFLIPYNFIEDFFIIYHVSASLEREAKDNASLGDLTSNGSKSGIGWCAAQILSLLPGVLGQIAGVLAIVLWVVHWRFIRVTIQSLEVGHNRQ